MPHLVGGGASKVKRCRSCSRIARGRVIAHNPIGAGRATWELGVSKQTGTQITYPEVHVIRRRPCIRTSLGGEFHRIVRPEGGQVCRHPQNAVCWIAVGILRGQTKLNLRVRRLRPFIVLVCIQSTKIFVQNVHLGHHLSLADVLSRRVVQDVKDNRNGHHQLRMLGRVGLHLAHVHFGLLLDQRHALGHFGFFMHQPFEVAHGVANSLTDVFVHLLASVLCLKRRQHQNRHCNSQDVKEERFHRIRYGLHQKIHFRRHK